MGLSAFPNWAPGDRRQAQLLKNVVGAVHSIQQIANGEWLIGCTSAHQQRKLLLQTTLPVQPSNPVCINTRIPLNVVVGVIKGVPKEPNAEQLLRDDLEAQDLHVDSVKRLNTKNGAPTGAVRVAFIRNQLPTTVKLGYSLHRVTPYIPPCIRNQLPTTVKLGYSLHRVTPYIPPIRRCTKCQTLGHSKQECRRKHARCVRCGKGHPTTECDSKTLFCVNYYGPHSASDHRCPEWGIRKLAHELKNTKLPTLQRGHHSCQVEVDHEGAKPGPVCTTRSYAITSIVVSDFESKRSNFVCMGRKSGSFSKYRGRNSVRIYFSDRS